MALMKWKILHMVQELRTNKKMSPRAALETLMLERIDTPKPKKKYEWRNESVLKEKRLRCERKGDSPKKV